MIVGHTANAPAASNILFQAHLERFHPSMWNCKRRATAAATAEIGAKGLSLRSFNRARAGWRIYRYVIFSEKTTRLGYFHTLCDSHFYYDRAEKLDKSAGIRNK